MSRDSVLDVIRPGVVLPALLGLAVAVWWRVLPGEFVFDDRVAVVERAEIKDLSGLLENPLRGYFSAGRPITDLTFALNYAAGGLDPFGYHLVNLAIHLAAVVLAWALVRRLLRLAGVQRSEGASLVVAALFALHPLQTQAVSYVAQRAEVLASALYLAGLLSLLAAERRAGRARTALAWAAAAVAFLLGLGAKSIVVTLPVAWLLVMGLVPSPEARATLLPWRIRWLVAAPTLAFVGWFSVHSVGALDSQHAGLSIPGLPPSVYFLTQLEVVPTYLRLILWPAGQNVDWRVAATRSIADPGALLGGLFLVALAVAAWMAAWRARRSSGESAAASRVAGAGVLFFLLVVAPTSSVVPLADLLMEHRVYLASLGIFAALVSATDQFLGRTQRLQQWARPLLSCAICGVLAFTAGVRNGAWISREALWGDSVRKNPRNARAWNNLAEAVLDGGRLEEGIAILQRGLPNADADPEQRGAMLGNQGKALMFLGRLEEAEQVLRLGLGVYPVHPDVVTNLATVLALQGRLGEAEGLLWPAVAANPEDGRATSTLGAVLLAQGEAQRALPLLERAVALDPDKPDRRLYRARALAGVGRTGEACVELAPLRTSYDAQLAADAARDFASLGCGEGR